MLMLMLVLMLMLASLVRTGLKLGPESNSRLRAKMVKFSDMLLVEREEKEYLRLF